MKFKVGDIVRRTEDSTQGRSGRILKGDIGVVTSTDKDYDLVDVRFFKGILWECSSQYIELVETDEQSPS